jgi:hypothetical protein
VSTNENVVRRQHSLQVANTKEWPGRVRTENENVVESLTSVTATKDVQVLAHEGCGVRTSRSRTYRTNNWHELSISALRNVKK